MSEPLPCPPAPGPLEAYAAHFDEVFARLAQRRSFREYLVGLLLPRDRNKTLTALVGAEPIVQAQDREVQQLQWFLSESSWDAEQLNRRRLELLLDDPATGPTADGVLIIDDSGDRKDGTKTAHVARQYLGSVGKIDNGIVVVTSLWANVDRYYPLHLCPYTPASRLAKGTTDPAFQTKPQIAKALIAQAQAAGVPFQAIVADSFYGDNLDFEQTLQDSELPYVLAVKPSKGHWAPIEAIHTPEEAAEQLAWTSVDEPGDWTAVTRRFRDGHEETWWAAELVFAHYGPERSRRLVVATTDPATLPGLSTWYLVTNLPAPGSLRATQTALPPTDLATIVRLYGLRMWVEQGYKQQKQELGWADFQVRSDRAIRRHWQLVVCAFTFCWEAWFHPPVTDPPPSAPVSERGEKSGGSSPNPAWGTLDGGRIVAAGDAGGPGVAGSLVDDPAYLGGVERAPTTAGSAHADRRARTGPANFSLLTPVATNYR